MSYRKSTRNGKLSRFGKKQRSLWEHSPAFRQLVWCAVGVGVLFFLGGTAQSKQTTAGTPTSALNTPSSQPITPTYTPPPTPTPTPNIASNTSIATHTLPPPQPVIQHATANTPNQDLSRFPEAQSSWGDYLNPSNEIPTTGFNAYYLRTDDLKTIVAREKVNRISLSYAYNEFHNINAQNFSAYWVGNLSVPQDSLYQFSVTLSWAKVRIIVDGHIILDASNSSKPTTVFLPTGNHKIEVLYTNNWHTVEFQMKVAPLSTNIPVSNLQQALAQLNPPRNTVVYLASVYRSSSRDNNIYLQPPSNHTPYILIVNSYEAVNWSLNGSPKPVAIIQSGNKNSNVSASGNPPVLLSNTSFSYYKNNDDISCRCAGGHFYCENNQSLSQIANQVLNETGFYLYGTSRRYSTDALVIPENAVNQSDLDNSQQNSDHIEAQRQACEKRGNAGFD